MLCWDSEEVPQSRDTETDTGSVRLEYQCILISYLIDYDRCCISMIGRGRRGSMPFVVSKSQVEGDIDVDRCASERLPLCCDEGVCSMSRRVVTEPSETVTEKIDAIVKRDVVIPWL